ncbi:MAG: hypothetical protein IJ629_01325 [Clostridia bacterium]|nr:hypothetical protein [Clostridia bacterium]
MELFKNIFFNTDKLTPYITVKITYAGKFFENKSKDVFLHFCFNNDWDNAKDIKMEKSELGYQAEIELNNEKSFNICFFNEKNEWDNNDSMNYNFPIEEAELSLVSLDDNWVSTQFLSRFYLWKKKFKVRVYRIIRFITGNYKRKVNEEKG